MADIPFNIDEEIVQLAESMDDEELECFAELNSDLTSDEQIELYAYLCLAIFRKSGSRDKLLLCADHVEGWVAVTPDDHPDAERRRQIYTGLLLEKLQITDLESSVTGAEAVEEEECEEDTIIKKADPNDPRFRKFIEVISRNRLAEHREMDIKLLDQELDQAEKTLEELELTANTSSEKVDCLIEVVYLLGQIFETTEQQEYLDRAITLCELAVDEIPEDDPRLHFFLNQLCLHLNARSSLTDNMEDNNQVSGHIKTALEAAGSAGNPAWELAFCTLALPFLSLGKIVTTPESSYKAFNYFRNDFLEATDLARLRSPRDFLYDLITLGITDGAPNESLDETIDAAEEVATGNNAPSLEGIGVVHALTMLLIARFLRLGIDAQEYGDLDRAIDLVTKTLRLTETTNNNNAKQLLGYIERCLSHHVEWTPGSQRHPEVVDRLIAVHEALVKHLHPNDNNWSIVVVKLMNELLRRSERNDDPEDVERAIELNATCIEILGGGEKNVSSLYINLSKRLLKRWDETREDEDIRRCVDAAEKAVDALSPTDHQIAHCLMDLGWSLTFRFKAFLNQDDIDRAVQTLGKSVDAFAKHATCGCTPNSALFKLASVHGVRFDVRREVADLDMAIKIVEHLIATQTTEDPDADILSERGLLGSLFYRRFAKTAIESRKDLDRGIQELEASLAPFLETDELSGKPIELSYLGSAYFARYKAARDSPDPPAGYVVDLDQSISMARKLSEVWPDGAGLGYLAMRLYERLNYNSLVDDIPVTRKALDEPIELLERAIRINKGDETGRWSLNVDLGKLLTVRYYIKDEDGDPEDLRRAEALRLELTNSTQIIPRTRIFAAQDLARMLAYQSRWEEAYKTIKTAVNLIDIVDARSVSDSDRQSSMASFFGLASAAAAIALNAGKDPAEALVLLEQGRAVSSSLTLEKRADLSRLATKNNKLASEFLSLRDELDTFDGLENVHPSGEALIAYESRARRRREAGKRFDEVIAEIRTVPGFENFFRPPTAAEFMAAAGHSRIAVINVSTWRCDAFLVDQHRIRFVPLPHLEASDIEEKAKYVNGTNEPLAWEVLEWLWDVIACPVLEAFGIDGSSTTTQGDAPVEDLLPHIWWITTGELSKLPLHAAGRHLERTNETVLDRVISSYSLSIKTMLHSRQHALPSETTSSSNTGSKPEVPQALLVAMPKTTGQPALRFAAHETTAVAALCTEMALNVTQIKPPNVSKSEVLDRLQTCKIFHFAGHGLSDPVDPLKSSLLLDDEKVSRLTAEDLWEQKLYNNPPFLAYLSACSTGVTNVASLSDEGVHLMSACQLAGFRHVIGTLWEVNDTHCVKVAKIVYETLKELGMTDSAVAVGLHRALTNLRDEAVTSKLKRKVHSHAGAPLDKGKAKAKPEEELNVITGADRLKEAAKVGEEDDQGIRAVYQSIMDNMTTFRKGQLKKIQYFEKTLADGSVERYRMRIKFGGLQCYTCENPAPHRHKFKATISRVSRSDGEGREDEESEMSDFTEDEAYSSDSEGEGEKINRVWITLPRPCAAEEADEDEGFVESNQRTGVPMNRNRKRPRLHWIPYVHFGL